MSQVLLRGQCRRFPSNQISWFTLDNYYHRYYDVLAPLDTNCREDTAEPRTGRRKSGWCSRSWTWPRPPASRRRRTAACRRTDSRTWSRSSPEFWMSTPFSASQKGSGRSAPDRRTCCSLQTANNNETSLITRLDMAIEKRIINYKTCLRSENTRRRRIHAWSDIYLTIDHIKNRQNYQDIIHQKTFNCLNWSAIFL
jgi:hypothetical protein